MSDCNEDQPTKPMNQKLLLLKLKRINELNDKLKGVLARDRIYASNASYSIINYTQQSRDYVLPEIWGYMSPGENTFRNGNRAPRQSRGSTGSSPGGCCTIV